MWIERGVINCRVARNTDEERRWLYEYLSFPDTTAHYRKGATDSRIRMFNVVTDTFPSGFLPMMLKAAKEQGLEVEVIDRRTPGVARDGAADLDWLRDYQAEAVERAIAREHGILWLPTGAGKTEVATGIVRALPTRWLFVVHRSTLMEQAAERYERRAAEHGTDQPPAGRIGEGKWSEGEFLTCATFQTLAAALKAGDSRAANFLKSVRGVIVDECHVLPAESFYGVMQAMHNARYRIGLSGTPLARGDRRSLLAIAALGPVIHRIKTDTLVDAGVLAKPTIRLVEVRQRSDKPTFQGVYGESIARSKLRNKTLVEAVKRAEKPTLLFVKEVAHGKVLTKMLERAGVPSAFVWGTHSTEQRNRQIRDLTAGRLECLVCSVVFQEGVDIPELRSVVIGSGGKSVIAALQRIGRGMRRADGKTTFEVFDIADRGCGCDEAAKQLGTPGRGLHSGCKWLERHTKERLRAYMVEGHTVVNEKWPVSINPDIDDV